MITVTTPNGRIGSHVLRLLLDRKETVRVVSQRPDLLAPSVRDTCDVVTGSLDDAQVLRRGFDGAETVFWCIPQSRMGNLWDDAHVYHQRFATAAAAALTGSGARVVAVSAGRHDYVDQGIVSALAAAEDTLNRSAVPIRHLRNAFFMENLLESLPTIAVPGAIFYNGPGDTALPMVCIADVAAKAVECLTDRSWHDQGHVAVHGPADVSFDAMAAVLSDVLDHPVRYIPVPDDVLITNIKRAGLPDGFARAYARLLTKDALEAYAMEPRTPETTTPTTLRDWAASTLLPAFQAYRAGLQQAAS